MKTLIVAALAAALSLAPATASPAEPEAAEATVRDLVETAHQALAGGNADADDLERLRGAIEGSFAMDLWQRFLLDDVEEAMSEDQRETVGDLMPGFLADLYRTQFSRGLSEEPMIGGVEALRRDQMVDVTFPRPEGRTLPTRMRVREIGGTARIIDIMVGGASFLRLKRDEFTAIVQGGGPEALITHLRENSV